MSLVIIYSLLYLIALTVITFFSSRHETPEEYINSAKNLSATESTFTTFASLLTGYNFVIGVTFAYLYGFWYLMAFVGAGLAFVVLYFLYKKRLSALQRDHNLLSIGDFFGLQYGALSRIGINIILLGGLLLFLILQIFINTGLFSALLEIEKIPALLLTTGIVCLYLWFGGFKASVKTDIFQGFLMLPIVLIIFFFPVNVSVEKIPSAFDLSQFWFAIGLSLVQFFSLLGQAESFQRVFAAKNAESLKRGLIFAFILLMLVAGSIAYLGVNFKLSGMITTDPTNLFIVDILSTLPKWLSSLLIVSLIAAFMGTIDSSAFAFGTLAMRLKKADNLSISHTRYFMLIGIIASTFASLYLFSFLSSVFALISLVSIIGVAVLVSFIFKLNSNQMNVFLLIGILVFILGLVFKFITDNPLTTMIPSVSALVVLLLMIFYQKINTKRFLISK